MVALLLLLAKERLTKEAIAGQNSRSRGHWWWFFTVRRLGEKFSNPCQSLHENEIKLGGGGGGRGGNDSPIYPLVRARTMWLTRQTRSKGCNLVQQGE
jgi:hypothetical protein